MVPVSVSEFREQIKLTSKVTALIPTKPVMYVVETTSAVIMNDLVPVSGFRFWLNEITELDEYSM